eukprot:Gregarina_sp_Pseudo_9__627@NODE_13_length_6388_cov_18_254528_g11_i0_p1_GENE_NODE_13_length_6388_cov_18_254528_g11_i0NODE_13_length_6388_cov_18_254528_g11_i0_p1_ORF_typecomplete_len745_score151_51ABC_tran/PF00005_27/5_6e21ABC_tran/PF00005_27/1_6e03ABC_tran/PF00005_27/2_8e21AAA_21/PF13304_6/1_4e09AAA_21/PF13304_6/4_7e11ABC_tran_Xtn/PF12848_7/33ABC_tran_Xtn/PF12848_7/2_5e20ABC_tran_Xtn/PF12848_7/5_1e02AAA_15/PF13175_6/1_6e06AAA_15/PF13175_6/0_17AAA_15/PF13175_6/0_84SMC_N/PF02463_19/15SMC_N/PF02463_
MAIQSADVSRCLNKLSSGKLDHDTSNYIAGMILEETADKKADEAVSVEELSEIICPFLWDIGIIKNDSEGVDFCRKVLEEAWGLEMEESDITKDLEMERPVVLMDLINEKVNRKKPMPEVKQDQTEEEMAAEAMSGGGGFEDPFLGLAKSQANFNTFIPINESMKLAKAMAKKREKQLRMMRQWEKSKVPLPAPRKKHGDKQLRRLIDVIVPSFSVAVAGRELLKDASLRLVLGHRYGLIGRNGIGKTTFLSALVRNEIPGVDPDMNVGCVEQEFLGDMESTPLDIVLKVDEERESLLLEEKRLTKESPTDEIGKRLTWIYSRLEEIESSRAEAEAAQILSGLGLSVEMYKQKKFKELSGGWRMRVMLARVLFADPDILCLDEPTNHLDLHAVAWLSAHLAKSNKTCIIVSHARHFLNDVCTDIMEFKDRQLRYWPGDYDAFEQAKADKMLTQQREFENQQAKRAHVQKFIDRFRYNANRAALVQSRIKFLEKLPLLDQVTEDPSLQFKFEAPTVLPTPMLVMQGASFAWDPTKAREKQYLLRDVDFTADLCTRAAICGVNGSGKSTFLKMLIGQVEPCEGMVFRHNKLRIGHFAQHHVDTLDLTKNAVQQLQVKYPDAKLTDEAARSFLGKFGISGMLALEPLFILSGGQKSRVAIAVMAFAAPHILVLDEPTNHLDLDAVQSLIAALNQFEGGVVLVSHDAHLLSCVVEEIYHVDPVSHTITKFKGDFDEYRSQLLRKPKPV